MVKVIEVKKLPTVPNICEQILREVWRNSQVSIAHVIMRKGEVSLLHQHNTFVEIYYVLSGTGRLTIGSKTFSVEKDNLVEIPKGTPHMLKNTGKGQLTHLVISTPKFDPKDVILL